jgi:uncharacterized protein
MANKVGEKTVSIFVKHLENTITYTGAELQPHWISKQTKFFGSAIISFAGPCDVKTDEMVDLEDRLQSFHIRSKEMLHFIGEWFEGDLNLAVAKQRLFIAGFMEVLQSKLSPENSAKLWRKGNDLYFGRGSQAKKLSVSIVTVSPVSSLFHFGVNIDASGAPVEAIGLKDLGVFTKDIVPEVLELWKTEWESMIKARAKVVPR